MIITPDEAREIITLSAREIFPNILLLRLQEAREAILSHLNLDISHFGYFPSGGAKFENYCSQVVKNLKSSGEMRTEVGLGFGPTQSGLRLRLLRLRLLRLRLLKLRLLKLRLLK